MEIAHLQRSIQREQAKVERYENNLLSAQAIATMLQVGGDVTSGEHCNSYG